MLSVSNVIHHLLMKIKSVSNIHKAPGMRNMLLWSSALAAETEPNPLH